MLPDPQAHGSLYLVLGAILLAGLIARRVPILRLLLSLSSVVLVGGLLILLIARGQSFAPFLGGLAGRAAASEQEVVGEEVRIRMSRDGHFWARVRMGDAERRMLIDSGATITSVSEELAAEAGIDTSGGMPVLLKTANGTVGARTATAPELRFGTIVARRLPIVVSPAFGDVNVLGMNFLSMLKSWRVEGKTLVLVPNHPQPVAEKPAGKA